MRRKHPHSCFGICGCFVLQVDAVLVADVADGEGMEELGLAADAEAEELVGVLGEPALEGAGGDAGQGGQLAF